MIYPLIRAKFSQIQSTMDFLLICYEFLREFSVIQSEAPKYWDGAQFFLIIVNSHMMSYFFRDLFI